jgi:hypothetical protein
MVKQAGIKARSSQRKVRMNMRLWVVVFWPVCTTDLLAFPDVLGRVVREIEIP